MAVMTHKANAAVYRAAELAVAGGLAGWALARVTGADRLRFLEAPAAPLLSFTPLAAGGAWLGALVLRGRAASATAAIAGAALTAAVAPRAMYRRQPAADGSALRLLTVNLLVGRASAEGVVGLVRDTGTDVLFLQELTGDAAARLSRAGLNDLLPCERTDLTAGDSRGNGIYARYPLRESPAISLAPGAVLAADLDLPSGPVRIGCVHLRSPTPPWSRRAVAQWRRELSALGPLAGPRPSEHPAVLAGDFNSTIDHAQFRRLLRLGYADAASQVGDGLTPTWGRRSGSRQALLTLDHILLDPRSAVAATSVYPVPGSDHRAVYAEIRLPALGTADHPAVADRRAGQSRNTDTSAVYRPDPVRGAYDATAPQRTDAVVSFRPHRATNLARGARTIRSFESALRPALLRTADYRAAARLAPAADDSDGAPAGASLADERRAFTFLLAEPALRTWPGSGECMPGQLAHLLAETGRGNVRLGIVPAAFSPGTPRSALPMHGFTLYDDSAVSVETFTRSLTLTAEHDVGARAVPGRGTVRQVER